MVNNDSFAPDVEETLTVIGVSGAASGAASVSGDGLSVIYTPNADFVGEETLTYTLSDGNGGQDTGSVVITVRDFVPSSVAGAVFIDSNGNGLRDFGESAVGGVQTCPLPPIQTVGG